MEIVALVLAGLGVGCTFVPRLPHVLVGYASMLAMHFAGAPAIDGRMLLFWGAAAAIVLAVDWLSHAPSPPHARATAMWPAERSWAPRGDTS